MNNRELIEKLNSYHAAPKIKVDGRYVAAPPAPAPVAKPPSKTDVYLESLLNKKPTYQEIIHQNGRVTWGFR